MGERFKLTASDGFVLEAYRARPEGKVRGGVVLIQEVWGINNWVRSVADRWARHGFLTIAPSMFDRVEPGFESENYGQDHFAPALTDAGGGCTLVDGHRSVPD